MKTIDRYAVIGDPVAHSLSPDMQRAAFATAGIDAEYEKEHVAPSALGAWVLAAREQHLSGFNVTIPHKESIIPYLDTIDESARRVGAVNTVINRGGRFTGYNTDLTGFAGILHSLGLRLNERPVVVLGSGGSARAVVRALADVGALLTICNRHEGTARTLASMLAIPATTAEMNSSTSTHAIQNSDLVVNTTPLGMSHLPISPVSTGTILNPRTVVIDLVYGPTTPLVRQARSAGCRVLDGIEMLVQQGAAAFELWTGVTPNLDVMRAACRRSLMEVDTCSVS